MQFLSAPDGDPVWGSAVARGPADKGYISAGIGIHVPVRRRLGRSEQTLHVATRMQNALIRDVRALGERTAAELKERWRTLARHPVAEVDDS